MLSEEEKDYLLDNLLTEDGNLNEAIVQKLADNGVSVNVKIKEDDSPYERRSSAFAFEAY